MKGKKKVAGRPIPIMRYNADGSRVLPGSEKRNDSLNQENQSNKFLVLTPEMIKTLPADVLTNLIEDRRSELKQLKIELIARII